MKKHKFLELYEQSRLRLPLRVQETDSNWSCDWVAADANGRHASRVDMELIVELLNALPTILEVIRQAGNVDSALRNGFVASVHNEALTSALENWHKLSDGPDTSKLRELWEARRVALDAVHEERRRLGINKNELTELTGRWSRELEEEGPESE